MTGVTALFWDVGGVLGTNGWDAPARARAVAKFDLDAAEIEARHSKAVVDFERGRLSLDEYLAGVVFYRRRAFDRDAFKDFMFSCSQPNPKTLALARALAESGRYLMATVNNESLELNLHRIETFGLRRWFSVFFSSCFLGVTKPDPEILPNTTGSKSCHSVEKSARGWGWSTCLMPLGSGGWPRTSAGAAPR